MLYFKIFFIIFYLLISLLSCNEQKEKVLLNDILRVAGEVPAEKVFSQRLGTIQLISDGYGGVIDLSPETGTIQSNLNQLFSSGEPISFEGVFELCYVDASKRYWILLTLSGEIDTYVQIVVQVDYDEISSFFSVENSSDIGTDSFFSSGMLVGNLADVDLLKDVDFPYPISYAYHSYPEGQLVNHYIIVLDNATFSERSSNKEYTTIGAIPQWH